MRPPLVSIIIAAFNAEESIANAIESARKQTISNIEIIVVDDASNDRTAAIVQDYVRQDSRIVLLPMHRNGGPGAARNAGFHASNGEWLAVLDADDIFLPIRLERLLALADDFRFEMLSDNLLLRYLDRDQTLIGGEAGSFDIDAIEFVRQNRSSRQQGRAQYGFLKPMIRRDFVERHQISYSPMRLAEDYFFALRCLLEGARWRVTREPLYIYTLRSDSLSATFSPIEVDAIATANALLLEHPRVKSDASLAREINESRNAASRAALWTRIVHAIRGKRWREVFHLFSRNRAAFSALIAGLHGALRKRVVKITTKLTTSR